MADNPTKTEKREQFYSKEWGLDKILQFQNKYLHACRFVDKWAGENQASIVNKIISKNKQSSWEIYKRRVKYIHRLQRNQPTSEMLQDCLWYRYHTVGKPTEALQTLYDTISDNFERIERYSGV